MIRIQHCGACGAAQYPPREFCGDCLSDRIEWRTSESLPARVMARTLVHHSNEPRFHAALPLTCGLVRLDSGPMVVCFVSSTAKPDDLVRVRRGDDGLFHAEA